MLNYRPQPFFVCALVPRPVTRFPSSILQPQGWTPIAQTSAPLLPGRAGQAPQPQAVGQAIPRVQPRFPASPAAGSATTRVSAPLPPAKTKSPTGLTPDAFTANGLTQEDLDEIVSKYGSEIDDIFNLAPGQSWMFGKAHKVTNAFFLQELLKVTMKLKPSTFRQRVDTMSLKRSNLRTAFAYRGQETPYQVVLKNRRPELRFLDRSDKTLSELEEELERYRAADRRRGFDLERDPLLRITVFSTAEEDTYALIVSQPHINHDGTSDMMLYKELLVDYVMEGKMALPELSAGSYQDYANYLQSIDKEAELHYWEELLSNSAATRLPGRVFTTLEPAINNLDLTFEGELGAKAVKLPQRYKATMNSIVQSAWGVMLQKIYSTQDAVFGSITSGRTAEVANHNTMTGGFVNAFPVRVAAQPEERFAEVVRRTQTQIIRSMQNAHCAPDEISDRLGRKEAVFDHLLNFHNFADTSQGAPAMPGITILGIEFFDNLSTGFCLYLHNEKDALSCNFSYDRRAFPERKIKILADCFRQIFEQLLEDETGEITVGELHCPDISAFITAQRDEEEERSRLESFLRTLPLFHGVDDEAISALAEQTEILACTEDDEIIREKQKTEGIHIVMEGLVQLSRTTMNGWENPLIARKKGNILSSSGVLENAVSSVFARAISGQVRIAYLPREAMQGFMAEHPVVALNLIREQEELAKTLSFLWINAD